MKNKNLQSDQNGQAVIEYVLMLVVSISLVILFVAEIFQPFGKFLDAYMGSYISCLLDMGELPTLGGDNGPLSGESDCNVRFESFSLKNGRPPSKGNSYSRSNENSSGKDQAKSNGKGSGGGSEEGEGSSEDNSTSKKGSSGGRFVGVGGPNSKNFLDGPRNGENNSLASKKVTEIDISGASSTGQLRPKNFGSGGSKNDKINNVDLSSWTEEDKKKLFPQNSSSRIIASTNVNTPVKKTVILKQNSKNESSSQADDDEFTIGNFLRLLIIIAIIIAIVVFVGGQLLQISKSE